MIYRSEIYNKAINEINSRKDKAERDAENTKMKFLAQCPKAMDLERNLKSTSVKIAKAVLSGGNVKKALEELKEINLATQNEFMQLLNEYGYKNSDIEPCYGCEACKDTGYVDGNMCDCLKECLKKISFDELNKSTPLEISGFDNYSLSFFDSFSDENKAEMEKNYSFCRNYADAFSLDSQSLLLYGATGLGKTHLSLAIAKVALEKAYGVVYGSAQSFVTKIEKERFSDEAQTNSLLLDCDLLIIDDLGVEFSSNYTQSVLYDIINTRILKEKPTIINTNLDGAELEKRYGERVISRFFGSYKRLRFIGKDIRKMKAEMYL